MAERTLMSPASAVVVEPPEKRGDHGARRSTVLGSDRRAAWVGALVGALVLLVVTIPRLNHHGLWLDESYSLGAAHQFVRTVRGTGATMSIYYLLLVPWAKVSVAAWWLRTLSLLFGLGTLPVVAALARRIGGRRLALVAPTILSLVYLFDAKAVEARAYALETLWVVVGWYALVRVFEIGVDAPKARRWWWLLAALAFVGPLAHGLFPLFVFAWLVALLLSPSPRRALLRAVPVVVATGLVVLGLYVHKASRVGEWVKPTTARRVLITIRHFTSTNRVVAVVLVVLVLVSWGLAGSAYRRSRGSLDPSERLDRWYALLPVVGVVIPFVSLLLVSVARPELVDRYLSPAAPMVALAIGIGAFAVSDELGRRFHRPDSAVLAGVAVVVVVALLAATQPAVGNADFEDWRGGTSYLSARVQPGDGLILLSSGDRPPFEAAWSEAHHPVNPPVINYARQRLGEVLRLDQNERSSVVRARLAGYDRVWLVTRKFEVGLASFTFASGLRYQYRLASRARFAVPDWDFEVDLYVRKGSPADVGR